MNLHRLTIAEDHDVHIHRRELLRSELDPETVRALFLERHIAKRHENVLAHHLDMDIIGGVRRQPDAGRVATPKPMSRRSPGVASTTRATSMICRKRIGRMVLYEDQSLQSKTTRISCMFLAGFKD